MNIDTNERSLDCATSKGELFRYDLSELSRLHHVYFEKRRAIQRMFWGDRRKFQRLQAKYCERERYRTEHLLHGISKDIIERAKENHFGILLEDLKYIRRAKDLALNRFNGKVQPVSRHIKRLKRRLNTWNFRKLQSYIKYKAKWEGIPVSYVDPWGASQICPICGCREKPNGQLLGAQNVDVWR
ncbi:IS200/IS605 family accessory protein TnpB-related protein [Candidatus Bathyarchaeota archaeon]|nr:IS200/IS605 family accessory protein TnpB-related protein [Candidatus Bathyarchaeota archaeon]